MAKITHVFCAFFIILITVEHCKSSLLVGDFRLGEMVTSEKLNDNKPVIKYQEAEPEQNYVVVMYGLNFLAYPDATKFVHMILDRVKGSDLQKKASSGIEVIDYLKPNPPPGQHEYWFILYKKDSDTALLNVPPHRARFNLQEFVDTNNLHKEADFFYRYRSP